MDPPEPPADLAGTERDAWSRGFQAACAMFRSYASTVLESYETADNGDETDSCPDCGSELVDSFGGKQCSECNYEP